MYLNQINSKNQLNSPKKHQKIILKKFLEMVTPEKIKKITIFF